VAIVTRSRSKLAEGDVVDAPENLPPDVSTLLQSPVPSSRRIADSIDDATTCPLDRQSPDQSTPGADRASVPPAVGGPPIDARTASTTMSVAGRAELSPPLDGHVPPSPTIEMSTPSDTTTTKHPTATSDVDVTVTPPTGNVLSRTNSNSATTAVIPRFLTVIQKKGKTSIHSYLAGCQDSHFQNLLQVYITFESAVATSGQTGSLSTTKRPSCISWWIRCACVNAPLSWSNLHDYGSSVITWWSSLQPSWRELECGTSNREEGPLDCLFQPGINGLLNIVILAYWWSNGLTESGNDSETEGPRYRWFVADVAWVLSKLLESARSD